MGKKKIVNLMSLSFAERSLLADAYGYTGIEVYPVEGDDRINAVKSLNKAGIVDASKVDDGCYIVEVTEEGEQLWETGELAPATPAPTEPDADGSKPIWHMEIQELRLEVEQSRLHIEALQADLASARARIAAAEEALRACINADVTGFWSPEEVAKRYFAAQQDGGKE